MDAAPDSAGLRGRCGRPGGHAGGGQRNVPLRPQPPAAHGPGPERPHSRPHGSNCAAVPHEGGGAAGRTHRRRARQERAGPGQGAVRQADRPSAGRRRRYRDGQSIYVHQLPERSASRPGALLRGQRGNPEPAAGAGVLRIRPPRDSPHHAQRTPEVRRPAFRDPLLEGAKSAGPGQTRGGY